MTPLRRQHFVADISQLLSICSIVYNCKIEILSESPETPLQITVVGFSYFGTKLAPKLKKGLRKSLQQCKKLLFWNCYNGENLLLGTILSDQAEAAAL